MELQEENFHCAGIMSFDFGPNPIYQELIELVEGANRLTPAKVYATGSSVGEVDKKIRDSWTCKDISELELEYPQILKLEEHLHEMMRITSERYMIKHKFNYLDAFDFLQFLKYGVGGKYNVHVDQHTDDRECSLMIYLNTVKDGGETYFPYYYDKTGNPIKIKAKEGRVLIFNCGHSAFHAGLPVKSGTKYTIYTFLCQDDQSNKQNRIYNIT